MSGARQQIGTLVRRDGKRCHYCNVETTRKGKSLATRDHIVPKSLGGANSLTNYVLACSECNSTRGNCLVYCYCDFCTDVVDKWIADNIWSFTNTGRFKIFKDEAGMWCTLFNGKRHNHKSHMAAVNAMNGIRKTFINNANTMENII